MTIDYESIKVGDVVCIKGNVIGGDSADTLFLEVLAQDDGDSNDNDGDNWILVMETDGNVTPVHRSSIRSHFVLKGKV